MLKNDGNRKITYNSADTMVIIVAGKNHYYMLKLVEKTMMVNGIFA